MKPNELESLKAEHGELWSVETDRGPVYFKCPDSKQYHRFIAMVSDEKRRAKAFESLALDVIVYPQDEELKNLLNCRPGVAVKVANEASTIAQGEEAEKAKKL